MKWNFQKCKTKQNDHKFNVKCERKISMNENYGKCKWKSTNGNGKYEWKISMNEKMAWFFKLNARLSISFYFFVWTFTVFSVSRLFQITLSFWRHERRRRVASLSLLAVLRVGTQQAFVGVDGRLQIFGNGLSNSCNLIHILLREPVGRAPVEPQIP